MYWFMNFIIRDVLLALVAAAGAQTLSDIGSASPSPGTNDLCQLSTQGNQTRPDGLNYFTDNL
jgi:hypothetical protein